MEKLMRLITLGSILAERLLLKRFLLGLAGLLLLGVIIGVLVAAAFIAGLYLVYHMLLEHGFTPEMTILLVGSIAVALIGMLSIIAKRHMRRMRLDFSPQTSRIEKVGEAFVDGLFNPTRT